MSSLPGGAALESAAIEVIPPAIAGPYAYLNECLFRTPLPGQLITIASLLEGSILPNILDAYAERHHGCDRRATASMWAQYYFSFLIPPLFVILSGKRLDVAVDPDRMAVILDADQCPRGFQIDEPGGTLEEPWLDRMSALVCGHLVPLVEAMAVHAAVSRRLLWSNAAVRLMGVAAFAADLPAPVCKTSAAGSMMLTTASFPDGRKNPFHNSVHAERSLSGTWHYRPRICCLRYRLSDLCVCSNCPRTACGTGAAGAR